MYPIKCPDMSAVFSVLPAEDVTSLQSISMQLSDAWAKRQIFRTETEARFSVLNDGRHPTPASKYWQSVREQTVMLDNLTSLSFEMRRIDLNIKRTRGKLSAATKEDAEELLIDLDELLWKKSSAEQVAHDRVREIMQWERLKNEQTAIDPTFNTKDVNEHQQTTIKLQLENRLSCLNAYSQQAEIMNVLGPLKTINKPACLDGLEKELQ